MNNKNIVTRKNVKIGDKVCRGPNWEYEDQDRGSVFGLVYEFSDSLVEPYVRVSWITAKNKEARRSAYMIARSEEDRPNFNLVFYDDTASKRTVGTVAKDGEQLPNLLEGAVENWNAALEFCTDLAIDAKDNDTSLEALIETFALYRKNIQKAICA